MSSSLFWSAVGFAWHPATGWLAAVALLFGALLIRRRPEIAGSVSRSLILFVFTLAGLLVSGITSAVGYGGVAEGLHELFLLLEGVIFIRLAGLLLFRLLLPQLRLTPPRLLEDIAIAVGYIGWGLIRLRYAGLDLSGIVATSAVITAIVAFSVQDTLGNILGGVALQLDSSIRVGDWVKVDDISGRVADIRWRSTTVVTRNGEMVVFPNSLLMKNRFTVVGRDEGLPNRWRRWIHFRVAYHFPPEKVIGVVEQGVRSAAIPRVAPVPMPDCVLLEFTECNAHYALRYWLTDPAADDPTDSMVRLHLLAALERASIPLALPEENLHLYREGERSDEVRHQREITRRIGILRHVDLFHSLTDAELRTVAERLQYAPFAAGDIITRQGAVAHWLYLLVEGEAEVLLEGHGDKPRSVATLGPGGFIGEMGLITGEPRTATVVAKSRVECYRLDKESFGGVLHSRPALAEEISRVIVSRRASLQLPEEDAPRSDQEEEHHFELLSRIRRFFGLIDRAA